MHYFIFSNSTWISAWHIYHYTISESSLNAPTVQPVFEFLQLFQKCLFLQSVCLREALTLNETPSFNHSLRVSILITEMERVWVKMTAEHFIIPEWPVKWWRLLKILPRDRESFSSLQLHQWTTEKRMLLSCSFIRTVTHRLALNLTTVLRGNCYHPRFYRWEKCRCRRINLPKVTPLWLDTAHTPTRVSLTFPRDRGSQVETNPVTAPRLFTSPSLLLVKALFLDVGISAIRFGFLVCGTELGTQ